MDDHGVFALHRLHPTPLTNSFGKLGEETASVLGNFAPGKFAKVWPEL